MCGGKCHVGHEDKHLDEVTFIVFAHAVCKGCGYGMKVDVIGNGLRLGVPTQCKNDKCKKWRGKIRPGKYNE